MKNSFLLWLVILILSGGQHVSGCDSCSYIILTRHTGLGGGSTDPFWYLASAPSPVPIGQAEITTAWSSLGLPQPLSNSNWITPPGTLTQIPGEYIYQIGFDLPPCSPGLLPRLRMCIGAKDAEIILNGTTIGQVHSQSVATEIVLNPGQYINLAGANWLKVVLQNPVSEYPVIDAKVWICCEDNSSVQTDSCQNPVSYLHTGWQLLPGMTDPVWEVTDQWSGGVWTPCQVVANPTGWNNPQPGSNWISPPAPYTTGATYTFRTTFINDYLCQLPQIPELHLAALSESAAIYLNGNLLGSSGSTVTPSIIINSSHIVLGTNYLTVVLPYSGNPPVISMKAWVCCSDQTGTISCGNKKEDWTNYANVFSEYRCALEYQCPGNEAILRFSITSPSRVSVKSNSGNSTEKLIIAKDPLPMNGLMSGQVLACGNMNYPATADLQIGDYYVIVDDYTNPGSHYYNVELRCDPIPALLPCPQLQNLYDLSTGHPATSGSTEDKFWNFLLSPASIITNPLAYGWGPPQSGSDWISYDLYPTNVTNQYTFGFSFIIPANCMNPFIQLSVLGAVGDMFLSDPMLTNVHQIGETRSLTNPFQMAHSFYLLPGNNTFFIILQNQVPDYPGINVTGTLCCEGGPAGIEENPEEKGYTIFPNPANDELQIETSAEMNGIHIYNGFGRLVYESGTVKELTRIPVGHLKEGIYFIRLQMANGCYSEKVIIEH